MFLTGAGNEVIAVRAMKAGADDYQRKQELTREKLVTSVRELARGKIEKTQPRPEVPRAPKGTSSARASRSRASRCCA